LRDLLLLSQRRIQLALQDIQFREAFNLPEFLFRFE
jgi:hypothetical protein